MMVGPIERIRRLLSNRAFVPVLMLVVCVNTQPDPTRRATGYGGVLPVPGPSAMPSPSSTKSDSAVVQNRRDVRAVRGRVLYAPGHAPHDTVALHDARAHKTECPVQQRMGQDRGAAAARSS
ncbi:MAG: hypothetical protein ABI442_03230 [Gemmatimonadaceae bacterium]